MKRISPNNNAASAANSKLQNILQNGRLSHLLDKKFWFSYEFLDDIRKLVRHIKVSDKPGGPRIKFNGIYNIVVGDLFKIRTHVKGELNKYEIGYTYVAPILFSDNFESDYVNPGFFVEISEFGLFRDSKINLDFSQFKVLFLGLLASKYYLDNFLKIDRQNKVIYYEIPYSFSSAALKKLFGRGERLLNKASKLIYKSQKSILSKKVNIWDIKLDNLLSYAIYSCLVGNSNEHLDLTQK